MNIRNNCFLVLFSSLFFDVHNLQFYGSSVYDSRYKQFEMVNDGKLQSIELAACKVQNWFRLFFVLNIRNYTSIQLNSYISRYMRNEKPNYLSQPRLVKLKVYIL